MRTYQELKNAIVKKKYVWYEKDVELNCIWERTSDVITNKFTDWLFIAYLENGEEKVICIPATTKPGLKGSILEPTTVEGITGTAIIKPGQYIHAWEFKDTYAAFSKYPYFHQIGKIDYWRDGDKDEEIDRINDQEDKIFGTHWHKMSKNGTYGTGNVNNWSLGCMGAVEIEFRKILPIVRTSSNSYGKKLTGTILESKDFNVTPFLPTIQTV